MHWKPPGVLVQEPKRQMLGSSSHSFISAGQKSLLIQSMFCSRVENIYLSMLQQTLINRGLRDDTVNTANLFF